MSASPVSAARAFVESQPATVGGAGPSAGRDRQRELFGALARATLRAAYSGALAVVARRADAEDVAQDALLAAYEKLHTCRDPERLRPWLLRIVRNRALNHLERRRLRDVPGTVEALDLEPIGADPADPFGAVHHPGLPDVALRQRLLAALARLSPTPRQVVLLHDTQAWTHQEIADHLGISVAMSRKHLFQARGVLRGLLSSEHAGEASGNAETPSPVGGWRVTRAVTPPRTGLARAAV